MKAPLFWSAPPGLISGLLTPVSWVWTSVTRKRLSARGLEIGIPVICVGNLTAGGTGKTPVVMALLERFTQDGVAAHVVSRGYGGSLEGPLRVDERKHSASQVGDEPLLLSAFGRVWVSKDRAKGAQAARDAGADVILLDDGFQNPSLVKTKSILVIDAEAGFGNGCVMPAGPLREPVADGMARADLIVLIGPKSARSDFLTDQSLSLDVLEAELTPLQTGMTWEGLRALAFAGIGRPQKFFDSLSRAGVDLIGTRSFGDHAPYRRDLLRRLLAEAKSKGAQLVTTEKDAVRLPQELRSEVLTFPVRLSFEDEARLETLVQQTLKPDLEL